MREIQSQLWWINSPQLTTTICSLKQWLTRSSGLCVCLRVCTCMRACACGRVCVPAHADVYVQVCMCVCESVRLRVCLNMCVYVSGGVCACACVSESECVHLCEGVYVHVWVICGLLGKYWESAPCWWAELACFEFCQTQTVWCCNTACFNCGSVNLYKCWTSMFFYFYISVNVWYCFTKHLDWNTAYVASPIIEGFFVYCLKELLHSSPDLSLIWLSSSGAHGPVDTSSSKMSVWKLLHVSLILPH